MEPLLREWNGETVIVHFDHPTRAWIFIAIHSTHLGPATGGTRMKSYASADAALQDALRLAEGMTRKFAVHSFPRGGGKAVIAIPSGFDPSSRPALLRRYGALIGQLRGLYYTGPDVGTSPEDMDIVAETGAPYVFSRTPENGGAGDSGPYTALGVFAAMQVTCERLFGEMSLQCRTVLVQGAGHVGRPLIGRLLAAGARVFFSDMDANAIHGFQGGRRLEFVSPDVVYDFACDIFAPCAMGGVLNADTIPRLRCRAVVGAANNQLGTSEDADRLRVRDILYAPDYVVNIGGAMAIIGMEDMGWSPAQVEREVMRIGETLRKVFEQAALEDITTEAAARHRAEDKTIREWCQ